MINFNLPWKVGKKPQTSAEQKLEEIKKLLFPPMELHEEMTKEGEVMKYYIDYSVDSNLDAALIDLYEGNNDQVTQNTISKAVTLLNKARTILEAYAEFDAEAKYIIVDNAKDDEIQARRD